MLLSLATCQHAVAGDYRFVKADEFKSWLQEGKKFAIIHIQPAADFEQQHFRKSVETNAFPGKSDESRHRLEATLQQLTASSGAIVIACPRGGGGVKATYYYLKSKRIDEQRLVILDGGMHVWPYQNLPETGGQK